MDPPISAEVRRLRSLLASGKLVHPFLSADFFALYESSSERTISSMMEGGVGNQYLRRSFDTSCLVDNFVDLAASLAMCCGVSDTASPRPSESYKSPYLLLNEEIERRRLRLASEIGDNKSSLHNSTKGVYSRRHIILILCDGMGNAIIENTLQRSAKPSTDNGANTTESPSFFIRNNQPSRLRSVFPSTTPSALTSLATATWPGRHGMPGWNLRDKKGCDFPGKENRAGPEVQLLVLAKQITDARSGRPASEMGFQSWDDVFFEIPWARKIASLDQPAAGSRTTQNCTHKNVSSVEETGTKYRIDRREKKATRRMIYINAYNSSHAATTTCSSEMCECDGGTKGNDETHFSSWQMGKLSNQNQCNLTLFETAKIEETSYHTLGTPKGATDAVQFFRNGIDTALKCIAGAEESGESTFIYLYTAHPDKHMHSLGVDHDEVKHVVRGIEKEVERLWEELGHHDETDHGGSKRSNQIGSDGIGESAIDASVIVTADHGHITVHHGDMLVLPQNILDCLEYANVGVFGTGRQAYLHCRAGLQDTLRNRWQMHLDLLENFILLAVDEAVDNGLFGPHTMRLEVRPRMGDFVAISIGKKTLVTPSEANELQTNGLCRGAHGSLLPEEMNIPFILLSPPNR